jgi:hypothetical protein
VRQSLIAFDTDHIKQYVFATDALKEIRGASSLLDFLNRVEMHRLKAQFKATDIYAHGGSGLFIVDTELADKFGRAVQKEYHEQSGGSASISYATQPLPDLPREKLQSENLQHELNLLQWRLRERKNAPSSAKAVPSHPFMQLCERCGLQYAETYVDSDNPNGGIDYCCNNCWRKHEEDRKVKRRIDDIVAEFHKTGDKPGGAYLWERLLQALIEVGYEIPEGIDRPQRTDDFKNFTVGQQVEHGYLGLIYADANAMGKKIASLQSLNHREALAKTIDEAIYKALAKALKEHIPNVFQVPHPIKDEFVPTFGFDVLLIGGDDILLLTHSSVAMQVATTLAKEFADWTRQQAAEDAALLPEVRQSLQESTLSVGVVLAPIKYPFRLLLDLVEDVLQHSKKKGAEAKPDPTYSTTFINFMTVTGNTSQQYKKEFESHLRYKPEDEATPIFYATLRPYPVTDLVTLLNLIREGKRDKVGRSKLHQLREAILLKNRSTSVVEGLVAMRNWEPRRRNFMIERVYPLGHELNAIDPQTVLTLFSPDHRVIFPWYYAGLEENRMVYQTPLLDFVELFDFLPEAVDEN